MSRESFNGFRSNIAIDNASDIARTYAKITKRLNREFYDILSDTYHTRQVGSYGRHTAIKGISDLDMIFELPDKLYDEYNSKSGNVQYKLLSRVKNALKESYPSTEIRVDGQIVSVRLSKYLVEVVPAFRLDDGRFKYPDSNDGGVWRICNPIAEKDSINFLNNEKNGNVKHLAKMMRSWKNTHGVPMSGMLIDTLVYRFFQNNDKYNNSGFASYKYLAKDFFAYLVSQPADKDFWRAPGSGSEVYKQGKFIPKAKKAFRKCNDALKDENQANKKWREVFGKKFPAAKQVTKSFDESARSYRDTEQSIEEMFPLNIRYGIELDANIGKDNRMLALLSKLTNRISKERDLKFFVQRTDHIPEPFDIYWKVKNTGPEAERKDMIRGHITKGGRYQEERSDFSGEHYVECYIIKDGFCVARESISVPI